jgi:hypothetical protein
MKTLSNNFAYGSKGWTTSSTAVDVQTLKGRLTAPCEFRDDEIFLERMKNTMAEQLSNEIIQRGLIVIQKNYNPLNPFEIEFLGEVKVVPPLNNNSKVVVQEDVYELEGNRFNHKQVEGALREMYPEYFI